MRRLVRRVDRQHGVALVAGVVAVVSVLTIGLLPTAARAQSHVVVRITDGLTPATVTVESGATVTWVNDDTERHRVRSVEDGVAEFDSGNLEPGERFSHVFTVEGATSYVDDRDRDDAAHHGTVVVARQGAPSPDPDPESGSGPAQSSRTVVVGMAGRRFAPASLSITTGDTVRFLNDDDRDHTATAEGSGFDTGVLAPGRSSSRTFDRAGTFRYLCLLHPDMTGTIAVAAPGGSAPPPAAPADAPPPPPPTDDGGGSGGGSATGGRGEPSPSRVQVEMRDFVFAPTDVEVAVGSTVEFRNTGRALHTATADDGSFDSGLVSAGGAFERRLDRAGTIAYRCLLHPGMTGRILVTGASVPGGGSSGGGAAGAPLADAAATGRGAAGAGEEPPPRAPGTVVVSLRDFVFAPAAVDVRVGDTVRFRNDGVALHTATARDGSHDSGLLAPGEVSDRTFRDAGTVDYWCTLHPDMVGTIRVAAADGTIPDAVSPSPSPSATSSAARPAPGRDDGSASAIGGSPVSVSVVDDDFRPATVEVVAGQEVVWTNDGEAVHTVTATDGSFDSGLVDPGETFGRRFEVPGTVAYLCSLHPGMVGEVVVLTAGPAGEEALAASGGTGGENGGGGGLPIAVLEVIMLTAFAAALAGFTVLAKRFGERGQLSA